MIVLLPGNLNLKAHVEKYPPVQIERFKLDKLAYLLSLLISVPAENKGVLNNHVGWVPLYSKILERRVRDYRHYFEYAAGGHNPDSGEAKLIEIYESYHPGQSKMYKFLYPYNSGLSYSEWEITYRTIRRNVRDRYLFRRQAVLELYPELVRWFDARRLKIDSEKAKQYAEFLREKNEQEMFSHLMFVTNRGRVMSKEMQERPKPALQFLSTLLNIKKIEQGLFFVSVDSNVRRLHSNLTNLKKEIRHFLTYDDKSLVSIDIKNSQPFLSIALFDVNFLVESDINTSNDFNNSEQPALSNDEDVIDEEDTIVELREAFLSATTNQSFEESEVAEIEVGAPAPIKRSVERFHLSTVAPELYSFLTSPQTKTRMRKGSEGENTQILKYSPTMDSLIMFSKSWDSTIQPEYGVDIVQFIDMVTRGVLYDEFAMLMKQKQGYENSDRSTAKEALILALFTSNSYINSAEAAPKRLFRDIFPTVYKYFSIFKKVDKSVLARLLQSIESWLVLDQVSKRISKERPELPIFTVHDSIITTEGNEQYVKDVMEDAIKRFIGHKPTLSVEYLKPEFLPDIESI